MALGDELAATVRRLSELLAQERAGAGKLSEALVAEKERLLAELESKGPQLGKAAGPAEAAELGKLLSDAYMSNALSERELKLRVKLNELSKPRPQSLGTSRVNIVS